VFEVKEITVVLKGIPAPVMYCPLATEAVELTLVSVVLPLVVVAVTVPVFTTLVKTYSTVK
jgi:hypothetical protein